MGRKILDTKFSWVRQKFLKKIISLRCHPTDINNDQFLTDKDKIVACDPH